MITTLTIADKCSAGNNYQKEIGDTNDNDSSGDEKTTLGINIIIQQKDKSKRHSTMQATICHMLIDVIQLDNT